MANYPGASYNRLYDPSAGPLWSREAGLSLTEDGDHYTSTRDFFEWWYFDAVFDNGYRFVAILHSSLYNAVDHKPTVDVRITPPDSSSILAIGRYSRSDYRAAKEYCDVRIAGCHAVLEGPGRYRLKLQVGEISTDLVYEALAPGWRPGTGYLFFDESSQHYFKWVVPLPLATVSGSLQLKGKSLQVQGTGYHDHNWGNFVLPDAFSHWYWGRFVASDRGETWSLVFGDVVGRGSEPEVVRPFLLIGGGTILDDIPKISFQSQQLVIEPLTGVRYPAKLDVHAEADSFQASLSLKTGRTMEALDFANPPFRRRLPRQLAEIAFYLSLDKPVFGSLARRILGKASYLRLQAEANLEVQNPDPICLSGDAIYEIMQF